MSSDLTVTEIHNFYRIENDQNWHRDFFDIRKFDAIILFTEGEIKYHFSHRDVVAKKGDILFLPGNLPYSGEKHTDSVSYFVIDFLCSDDSDFEKLGAPCTIGTEDFNSLLSRFSNINHIYNSHLLNASLKIKSFIYYLLSENCKQEDDTKISAHISNILDYISKNATNCKLSLKKICNDNYTSESQLRRYIHKYTGLSPNAYITALRINKAKDELSNTDKSIKTISLECGFESPYYFSKVFSKKVGISPSKYRTQSHY